MTTLDLTRRTILDGAFDVHSLRVGPFSVHRVADIDRVKWPATAMFRALSGEALVRAAARTPAGMVDVEGGGILLSFNSYIVETPDAVVLIDAGIGNDKERHDRPLWHRRSSRFLEALDALSFPADRIDVVINTHLHADHVGWNTSTVGGAWVPTFPRARYVTPKDELAYWSKLYETQGAETLHGAYADSVAPLLTHGKLGAVETPCEIVPGLRLEPASGHAPGMCVVRLNAAGTDILFLADVVHHPLQLSDPDTTSNFCMDPMMATATRRRILDECAARGTIVAPYHFPSPVFGRFQKAGVGYDYVPL
jgi:glyoxylase-like metal-dependent hydrolase (beta-lactamase superfamily II)